MPCPALDATLSSSCAEASIRSRCVRQRPRSPYSAALRYRSEGNAGPLRVSALSLHGAAPRPACLGSPAPLYFCETPAYRRGSHVYPTRGLVLLPPSDFTRCAALRCSAPACGPLAETKGAKRRRRSLDAGIALCMSCSYSRPTAAPDSPPSPTLLEPELHGARMC